MKSTPSKRYATTEAEAVHACHWCEDMTTTLYGGRCLAGQGCNTEIDTETLAHNVA